MDNAKSKKRPVTPDKDNQRPLKKKYYSILEIPDKQQDVIELNSIGGLKICVSKDDSKKLGEIIPIERRDKLYHEECGQIEKSTTKVEYTYFYKIFLSRILKENCEIYKNMSVKCNFFLNQKKKVIVSDLFFDLYIEFHEKNVRKVWDITVLFKDLDDNDFILKVATKWDSVGDGHIFLLKINRDRDIFTIIDTHHQWGNKSANYNYLKEVLKQIFMNERIELFDNSSHIDFQKYDDDFKSEGYCTLWSLYFIWKYITSDLDFTQIYKQLETLGEKSSDKHIYQYLILIFYNTVGHFTRSETLLFKKSPKKKSPKNKSPKNKSPKKKIPKNKSLKKIPKNKSLKKISKNKSPKNKSLKKISKKKSAQKKNSK
jgi:hypothetical protein